MSVHNFDTRLIHGGASQHLDADGAAAGVTPAIELSTTFIRQDPRDAQEFIYSRSANPNRRALERRLASIESAFDAAAFASGSAAAMALFQTLPAHSHIIVTADAYYGVVMLLNDLVRKMGHEVSAIDTTRTDEILKNCRKNTRMIWLETPSNPQMQVSDIHAVAGIAHQHQAVLCCDNTVATSVLQNPLALGADFSMHSSTKFFGGHSDVTGGVIIAAEDSPQFQRLREIQALAGATPSPFDCWLLQRSLATLGLRVRHQNQTARALANFLEAHAAVETVLYPGLPSHPQADLIGRQMSGGGAVLSFLLKDGHEKALRVARSTRIIKQATSLGGVESLIEHRRSVEGDTSLSPDNLVRLSVGLEDVNDLTDDLAGALSAP